MEEVRVLVVSEDPLVRSGLASLLAGQPGIVVEGQMSPDELPPEAGEPEVAVWDAGSGTSGLEHLDGKASRPLRILGVLAGEGQAADALAARVRRVLPRHARGAGIAAS